MFVYPYLSDGVYSESKCLHVCLNVIRSLSVSVCLFSVSLSLTVSLPSTILLLYMYMRCPVTYFAERALCHPLLRLAHQSIRPQQLALPSLPQPFLLLLTIIIIRSSAKKTRAKLMDSATEQLSVYYTNAVLTDNIV